MAANAPSDYWLLAHMVWKEAHRVRDLIRQRRFTLLPAIADGLVCIEGPEPLKRLAQDAAFDARLTYDAWVAGDIRAADELPGDEGPNGGTDNHHRSQDWALGIGGFPSLTSLSVPPGGSTDFLL